MTWPAAGPRPPAATQTACDGPKLEGPWGARADGGGAEPPRRGPAAAPSPNPLALRIAASIFPANLPRAGRPSCASAAEGWPSG